MNPNRITIHCSDSKNGERVDISVIREWHLARGWKDIGYHMVIQPDGEIQNGRSLKEQGAHVEGENENNLGICLVGKTRFSRAQMDSLRRRLDDITMLYQIRPWNIFCHYQFSSAIKQGKTCPNMSINRLISWYIGHYEEAIWPYLLENKKGVELNAKGDFL